MIIAGKATFMIRMFTGRIPAKIMGEEAILYRTKAPVMLLTQKQKLYSFHSLSLFGLANVYVHLYRKVVDSMFNGLLWASQCVVVYNLAGGISTINLYTIFIENEYAT